MDQEGKISPMPNASDVGAREASWLPTTIEIGAVSITEKGEANGIATLNSQGRLVQMPDAEDVGAHPNTWLPAASEIGAVPNLLINSSFRSTSGDRKSIPGRLGSIFILLTGGWRMDVPLLREKPIQVRQ